MILLFDHGPIITSGSHSVIGSLSLTRLALLTRFFSNGNGSRAFYAVLSPKTAPLHRTRFSCLLRLLFYLGTLLSHGCVYARKSLISLTSYGALTHMPNGSHFTLGYLRSIFIGNGIWSMSKFGSRHNSRNPKFNALIQFGARHLNGL